MGIGLQKKQLHVYTVSKNIPDTCDSNLNKNYQILNFWCEYSWHNLPLNYRSVFHLTKCLLLHYLGKENQAKYALK